ncbi:MAG: L-lactate permease [Anaerolineales bacterium]
MLDPFLAALPILLILALMILFRWSAARAGPLGWAAALAIAVVRFGAGAQVIFVAQGKALLLSLDVLWVVWAAYGLYRIAHEAGAIEVIRRGVSRLTADRGMQAMLLGWAFASFLQGVGGYGVPVAVTAPLLLGLGFSPIQAMLIPSIGHAWSVTYGSVAASFQALMAASGIDGAVLAPPTSLLLGLAGFACGIGVLHVAGGWDQVRRHLIPLVVLGAAMGGVQAWLAGLGLWTAAAFGAGLAGMGVGIVLARARIDRALTQDPPVSRTSDLALALAGYAILVGLIVAVQFTPGLRQSLSAVQIHMLFPRVATTGGHVTPAEAGRMIALLTHPGTLLAVSAIASYGIYRAFGRLPSGSGRRAIRATTGRMAESGIAVASMISMAVVMTHAGMTASLASGLARAFGALYPVAAPWVGALGAFMTGSNTNSNALFTGLQQETAALLGLSIPVILAGQTAGASIASVLAPTKVLVGIGTVGMAGQEGVILRRLAVYLVPILAGLSLAVILLA